MLGYFFLRLL